MTAHESVLVGITGDWKYHEVSSGDPLQPVTEALTAGRDRLALRRAWRVAWKAVGREDRVVVERLVALADAAEGEADLPNKSAAEFRELKAYCEACLAAGPKMKSPSAFGRLFDGH